MATPKCRFVEGETLHRFDYTPDGADVAAGDVVLVGTGLTGICHRTIKDGELGSLAAGGGIYEAEALEAIEAGDDVFWATESVTDGISATAGTFIGKAVTTTDEGDKVRFLHLQATPAAV